MTSDYCYNCKFHNHYGDEEYYDGCYCDIEEADNKYHDDCCNDKTKCSFWHIAPELDKKRIELLPRISEKMEWIEGWDVSQKLMNIMIHVSNCDRCRSLFKEIDDHYDAVNRN